MQVDWEFECPECETVSTAMTNLDPRSENDKYTEKRINTSVFCGSCESVTIVSDVDKYLDQPEVDWTHPNVSKPVGFVDKPFPKKGDKVGKSKKSGKDIKIVEVVDGATSKTARKRVLRVR